MKILIVTDIQKLIHIIGLENFFKPEYKTIMLTADYISETKKLRSIQQKKQLSGIENRVYAEENTKKLQFETDPLWYGGLCRNYFFNKTHQRQRC